MGITIFTAVYNNKIATNLPREIGAVVLGSGGSQEMVQEVLAALALPAPPPITLSHIPGLPAKLIGPILNASTVASAQSWKFVWVAIA